MQAVILAGGLGTRLRPVTEQIPKVMVPVNGKPFLLHLVELLKSNGVNDAILCIGYLGGKVRNFFEHERSPGLKIRYSEEKEELLGTGGALKQAQNLLENHFFVINGDTYLPLDYAEVERTFLNRGKKALMVAYDNQEDTGVKNNVALDENLMVIKHDKGGHSPDLKFVEAGVLVLKREALELIRKGSRISLEKGLYPGLIQQGQLAAYVTGQRFYDIGTMEQKRNFEELLQKGMK